MRKRQLTYIIVLFLLAIPLSYAAEEEQQSCGLTNLASCIPEKIYEYTLSIINAPLQPFLTLTKNLLSEPINLESFIPLWAIIVYIISFIILISHSSKCFSTNFTIIFSTIFKSIMIIIK